MRAYNAREGLTRDHDTLPKKLFTQPLSGGRSDGLVLDPAELDYALTTYFELAGWDVETGTPRRATLEAVGLGWVAEELEG
jgi:aldehyde:ferredoxin oxidoreductase